MNCVSIPDLIFCRNEVKTVFFWILGYHQNPSADWTGYSNHRTTGEDRQTAAGENQETEETTTRIPGTCT